MFDSVGWAEILVLVVAGLFILGPERLPEAAAWFGRAAARAREFTAGAGQKVRAEMPEIDELSRPVRELDRMRRGGVRGALKGVLDDESPTR
ncbi:twin-arginine translocase TatA/TatE family subunit [Pseudonocardia nantongensis]|uniref:twin-arginine translocase TatA/TatE family subunit n=1 Tax=Pseudonocardia nantongensis TaxID=1181885 RepID=UPI003979D95B